MSCPSGCDGYTADGSGVRERWKKASKPRRGRCIRSFRNPSLPSSVALTSVVCIATAPSIRPRCCLSLNTNPCPQKTNTNYSRGWRRAWVPWSYEPRSCRPAAGRESTIRKPHPRHMRSPPGTARMAAPVPEGRKTPMGPRLANASPGQSSTWGGRRARKGVPRPRPPDARVH